MVVQYQGQQNGVATGFTLNITKKSKLNKGSVFQMDLKINNQLLPIYKTAFHKSIAACMKDVYLFKKFNQIELNATTEKRGNNTILMDAITFDNYKATFLMA